MPSRADEFLVCVERLDFIHHLFQHLRRISSLRCRARPAVFCIAFWQAAFFACAAVVRATVLCSLLSLRISRHPGRNTLMVVAFVFQCAIGLVLPYRESTSILQVSKLAHHSLAFQCVWSQNRLHDPFTKLLKTYQCSVIHQVMGSVDSVRCYASRVLNWQSFSHRFALNKALVLNPSFGAFPSELPCTGEIE